jgi:hypothetical protein
MAETSSMDGTDKVNDCHDNGGVVLLDRHVFEFEAVSLMHKVAVNLFVS